MNQKFTKVLYILFLPILWVLLFGMVLKKAYSSRIEMIVSALIASIFIWLWFLFPFMAYRDAKKRMNKSAAVIWTIVCVFTSLLGYLIYMIIRPDMPKLCKKCGKIIKVEYKHCPYCGTVITEFCRKCGKEIKSDWKLCAYCGSKISKEE